MRLQISVAVILQFLLACVCCEARAGEGDLEIAEESIFGKWYMQSTDEAIGITVVTDLEIDLQPDHWAVIRDRGRIDTVVSNETFRSPWTLKGSTVVLEDLFAKKYFVEGKYSKDSEEMDWNLEIRKAGDGTLSLSLPNVDTPFQRTKQRQRRLSIGGLFYDIGISFILGLFFLWKPGAVLKNISDEEKRLKNVKRLRVVGIVLVVISAIRLFGVVAGFDQRYNL